MTYVDKRVTKRQNPKRMSRTKQPAVVVSEIQKEVIVKPIKAEDLTVSNVTAIVVNRKTLDFTKKCIESLTTFYPDIKIVVVDNWSNDESLGYVKSLSGKPNFTIVLNSNTHPHHAIGLNLGVREVKTRFFLTLDSDVEVLRGGWIEEMLKMFYDQDMLAVGHITMNSSCNCTDLPKRGDKVYHYVHPFCALWDNEKFKVIGVPFVETGQPVCEIFKAGEKIGFHVGSVPGLNVHNLPEPYYVRHAWGGTRDMLATLADRERKK